MLKRTFTRLAIGQWAELTLNKAEYFGGRLIPAGPVKLWHGRNFGFVSWRDATGPHLAKE